MAEITLPQKTGKRRKLPQPRIDLTPMVDLGFLLITFFMYTTTMTQHKVMDIQLPSTDKTSSPTAFPEESTITLIPVSRHRILYYNGAFDPERPMLATTFSETNGIRDILIKKQNNVRHLPASFSTDAHKLHVIVKPSDDCVYDDIVKVLDEMNILAVPVYTMADISGMEKETMNNIYSQPYGK